MVISTENSGKGIISKTEFDIKVIVKENVEKFDRQKITNSMVKEAGIDYSKASSIIETVVDRILSSNNKYITSRQIREMALSVLYENGMNDAYRAYSTIGIPVFDIEELILHGNKDNANVSFNPQSIMGALSDELLKKHALMRLLPAHLSRAHIDCEFHIKDLHFFGLGMFCQAWDTRMPLRFGLPPTRTLKTYKYSKPTSDMRVACLHLANWFSYAQSVFSGGQGYIGFNTALAPYARGLSDKELKKALTSFVFQVNQQRDSRGHQLPFTSIDMNFGIDPHMKDCHAVFDGNLLNRTYGDYEEEAIRIISQLCDIYKAGDANNTPFSFAKFELKVNKEKIEKYPEIWKKVVDLIAYNGTPYILNGEKIPESAHSQCCRMIFNPDGSMSKYCVEPKKFIQTDDHFTNFGSIISTCINLPRLALDARGDEDLVFKLYKERLDKMLEVTKIKRDITLRNLARRFPYLYSIRIGDGIMKETEPLIDMDVQSSNVGFVGLNELVENMYGKKCHLGTDEGHVMGERYLEFMSKWCEEVSIRNKMMISMWEQPAESISQRFASYDLKKFGRNIAVQGDINGDMKHVYYTNSSHIPYSYPVELHRRLLLQGKYHPIIKGGVISHIWLGDHYPEVGSLSNLIVKILTETDNYYFTFTTNFTICSKCGITERGKLEKCGNCGSTNIDYISRITGYYALVSQFNEGKLQEFNERELYTI